MAIFPYMKSLTVMCSLLVATVPLAGLECIAVPLKTSVEKSEIVLVGQVESVRYAMDPERSDSTTHYIATVRVMELWKGSTPTTIELHQPFVGGGMDLHQSIGSTYLFFLRQLTPAHPLNHRIAHPPMTSAMNSVRAIGRHPNQEEPEVPDGGGLWRFGDTVSGANHSK